jgi:hypothetical protein
MYKLYCSVLNDRLSKWLENNDKLADEQNGFRKGRSIIDHLASLTSIIESRLKKRLPTFAAFIDFQNFKKHMIESIDPLCGTVLLEWG